MVLGIRRFNCTLVVTIMSFGLMPVQVVSFLRFCMQFIICMMTKLQSMDAAGLYLQTEDGDQNRVIVPFRIFLGMNEVERNAFG